MPESLRLPAVAVQVRVVCAEVASRPVLRRPECSRIIPGCSFRLLRASGQFLGRQALVISGVHYYPSNRGCLGSSTVNKYFPLIVGQMSWDG